MFARKLRSIIALYIYIYIYVCVCVCVLYVHRSMKPLDEL